MERLLHLSDEELQRKVFRSTLVTRIFLTAAVLLGVVSVIVSLLIAASTNRIVKSVEAQQQTLESNQESIKELAQDIRSCTDPAGTCARRSAEETGAAIAQINQYGLFVMSCADQPGQQTEVEIRQCADGLAARYEAVE